MRHSVQLEGFGIRLRAVCMSDAPFIVWLRSSAHAKGRIGDTTPDVAGQRAWLAKYFDRADDYYFIIETKHGIPVGTQGVYDIHGTSAEVGRWVVRPQVQAAIPSYLLILDFAFEQLKLSEVRATTIATNASMISLNKRVGFEDFRTVPRERIINGRAVDIVHCVLRAEKWQESKQMLLPLARVAEELVRQWELAQLDAHPGQPPATIYGSVEPNVGTEELHDHDRHRQQQCQKELPQNARRIGMVLLVLSVMTLWAGSGQCRNRTRPMLALGAFTPRVVAYS